jgi:hypothetical protein|tara:strand:- start:190 stop:348 length:159 start_codon:yes stop_codon:yes gene_type:complete
MIENFYDNDAFYIFVFGCVVSGIFLIGIWELFRAKFVGVEGALTEKIKKIKN